MPRPRPVGSLARLVLVALAGLLLVVAGALSLRDEVVREEALPTWIPPELGGLTVRPGDARLLSVTPDEAIAAASSRAFPGGDPESEPVAIPVRVTGLYLPLGGAPVSPTGHVDLARAEDEPVWLVAWRRLDEGARDVPPRESGVLVNAFFLVDGETGTCCLESLFTAPG